MDRLFTVEDHLVIVITCMMYDVNKEVFFNWMTAVEGEMSKNCLK